MLTPDLPNTHDSLKVSIGCRLHYLVAEPTLILLMIRPQPSTMQALISETFIAPERFSGETLLDTHGNSIFKIKLPPGLHEFGHEALYLASDFDEMGELSDSDFPEDYPYEVLRYTFPSRYCESDKLACFARQTFGHLRKGPETIKAVCDWIFHNIEYRYGSGDQFLSASDVINRQYGVCRDFAHITVALCRALDFPARYVAGHIPYAGVSDDGSDIGKDFHAYAEVYFAGRWHTCDARFNSAHPGRIKIAHGMDAVDTAIATTYGDASLVKFQVWAEMAEHASSGPKALQAQC